MPRRDSIRDELLNSWQQSDDDNYAVYPDRTYAWLVMKLEQELSYYYSDENIDDVPSRKTGRLTRWANETLEAIYVAYEEYEILPRPRKIIGALASTTERYRDSGSVFLFLREACRAYLQQAQLGANRDVPRTLSPGSAQTAHLKRTIPLGTEKSSLAPVRRQNREKTNLTIRLEANLKPLIARAAAGVGVSQSKWIEQIIVQGLKSAGYEATLQAPFSWQKRNNPLPIDPPRASIPRTDLSPNASANRVQWPTTIRMERGLIQKIDVARHPDESRSAWLLDAVILFIKQGGALPDSEEELEAKSVVISISFGRSITASIDERLLTSGLTRSEWLRRVARWRLDQ